MTNKGEEEEEIKKGKEEIENELMNSIVPLYPAGRIYQMHLIEERIHFSHSTQLDYSNFVIISTAPTDHLMKNYLFSFNNFIDYED